MSKKVNIFSNLYAITLEIREVLEKELQSNGFIIMEEFDANADYNIVIGGDGTFIKAVHDSNFSQIPFIGINTGHLGFYNDVDYSDVVETIQKIKNGDYITNSLRVIDCVINTDETSYAFKSLNEIVLKTKYTDVLHFNLYVDDMLLESFAGDGVIFSTPSGSTAYSLSAGGSIIYQNIDAFQITPLAPIRTALHRSLDKSVLVPKNTKIKLITRRREETDFALGIDGISQEFDNINFIDIRLADEKINKIVFDKNWFWKNIKDKFI